MADRAALGLGRIQKLCGLKRLAKVLRSGDLDLRLVILAGEPNNAKVVSVYAKSRTIDGAPIDMPVVVMNRARSFPDPPVSRENLISRISSELCPR